MVCEQNLCKSDLLRLVHTCDISISINISISIRKRKCEP